MIRLATPMLAAVLLLVAPAAAIPAPHVSAATVNDLPKPLPLPYDGGKSDANAAVAAAKARALAEHKLLLIDMGGNWCLDCRILAGVTELPEVKRFVDAHYVEVTVDCGRHMEANLQIPKHYGVDLSKGVPALLVIDPRTDRILNRGQVSALENARAMGLQSLADWLAQWVR